VEGVTSIPCRSLAEFPLPGQANECPGRDTIDEEEEWEVDQVIESRLYYNKLQCQVVARMEPRSHIL
jgi:hypothetical protein